MRKCPRCHGKGVLKPSNYAKGRRFEWKVRDLLRDRGYTVYRAYGSKGILDLIAVKGEKVLGIQCKNNDKAYLPPKDRAKVLYVFNNRDYTISYWDGKESKLRSKDFTITEILHCFGNIKFLRFMGNDNWEVYKA